MKNNLITIFLFFILSLSFNSPILSDEQFNFDVTEVEIKDSGNKFIGRKKGIATTNDGLSIEANNFEYDKKLNSLITKQIFIYYLTHFSEDSFLVIF